MFSYSLNNTSDDVRLFTPTDSFSYDKTYENQSWGRIPDGTGGFTNKLIPFPGSPNLIPTPEPTSTPESTSTSNSSSDKSDQEEESNDTSDQEDQNTGEYKGVVAGYKTTVQDSNQENVADLEISPIFEATNSATVSASGLVNKDMATESSILHKKVNIPIMVGSGLIATGIVATLLKKYNIGLLWKKLKS